MTVLEIFDLVGAGALAISGALVAMRKRLDPFGVFIIAFVTAVGGGTLRDVLIDRHPLGWMENVNTVYSIIAGTSVAMILRNQLRHVSKSLFIFDSLGLGIITINGLKLGLAADIHPVISIALGTMSACFGGVIRDILCNEIPLIFRKEIYATISIFGAISFLSMQYLGLMETVNYFITVGLVVAIRIIAVRKNLSLPTLNLK